MSWIGQKNLEWENHKVELARKLLHHFLTLTFRSDKKVWPAPFARWSVKVPVSGLHKLIRHVGAVAAAKMESRTPRAS